jgi:predicted transcriptional regulator
MDEILKLLKERGEWMLGAEIAAALGRTTQSVVVSLRPLVQGGKVEAEAVIYRIKSRGGGARTTRYRVSVCVEGIGVAWLDAKLPEVRGVARVVKGRAGFLRRG